MTEDVRAVVLLVIFFGWLYFDMFHRHDPRKED